MNEIEENKMYQALSDALLEVCETKPSNPIEFLAKSLLSKTGDNFDEFRKKTRTKTTKVKVY